MSTDESKDKPPAAKKAARKKAPAKKAAPKVSPLRLKSATWDAESAILRCTHEMTIEGSKEPLRSTGHLTLGDLGKLLERVPWRVVSDADATDEFETVMRTLEDADREQQ